MKNKYIHRAKINERKFKQMLQLFCLDLTASQIADVTGINRNTVNRYIYEIRCRISEYCRRKAAGGSLNSSKTCLSYGSPGKDVSTGKVRLVGVVKNNGKISCRMVPEGKAAMLQHLNVSETNDNRNRMTVGDENYNGLIDLRRMKYYKLRTNGNRGNGKGRGIDICEGFWGVARGRLQRFRGLRKSTLPLHIRECEFRYNHGQKELYPLLLQIIRERPLFQQPAARLPESAECMYG